MCDADSEALTVASAVSAGVDATASRRCGEANGDDVEASVGTQSPKRDGMESGEPDNEDATTTAVAAQVETEDRAESSDGSAGSSSDPDSADGRDCGSNDAGGDEDGGGSSKEDSDSDRLPESVLRDDEPVNPHEQMEDFFRTGEPPTFRTRKAAQPPQSDSTTAGNSTANSGGDGAVEAAESMARVSTDLLTEATQVLDSVLSKFGSYQNFLEASCGEIISEEEADTYLTSFLKTNRIKGKLAVKWVRGLNAAGKVNYSFRTKKPEDRKFTLWVARVDPDKASHSSVLRARGIHAFAFHEIGTHLVRALNDGLQPWARKRQQFGLRPRQNTRADIAAEEGLATLNTMLPLQHQYLWSAALLYYAAAKADTMTFKELFDHLERYMPDKEARWKQVRWARLCVVVSSRCAVVQGCGCGSDLI